jgi:sRNA-binding regulator protein Hfq
MQTNLIDNTIRQYIDSGAEAGISLHDGSVVKGRITDFDGYVVIVGSEVPAMVYRHSILKISDASSLTDKRPPAVPRPARTEKPGPGKSGTQPARQDRPVHRQKPAPKQRTDKRPPRPAPQEKAAPSGDDFANPMAEKLANWLKSQKGGE